MAVAVRPALTGLADAVAVGRARRIGRTTGAIAVGRPALTDLTAAVAVGRAALTDLADAVAVGPALTDLADAVAVGRARRIGRTTRAVAVGRAALTDLAGAVATYGTLRLHRARHNEQRREEYQHGHRSSHPLYDPISHSLILGVGCLISWTPVSLLPANEAIDVAG
jgi:hypothetical protein